MAPEMEAWISRKYFTWIIEQLAIVSSVADICKGGGFHDRLLPASIGSLQTSASVHVSY